jgi:YegS/Rv2252/BmrU family lipid kinase
VSERRLALFANPAAAGGRAMAALPAIRAELERLGVEHRLVDTRGVDHAREEARAAAEAGETVVAVGGDGLVGCLAGGLRGGAGPLAIIPSGRGNDFARALKIPTEPREAARVAVDGAERVLDLGLANGRPFVGIASLGFDSDANRIANEAKLIKGNLVYLYAALRTLVAWKHARFRVTVDGDAREVVGYSVAVGNSKAYGGGMFVFPHAKLDDGLLDVLTIAKHGKLKWLAGVPKVFKGTHVDSPYGRFDKGERVEVVADRPFTVYADGDPIAELPLEVTVEKASLRVIVPRGQTQAVPVA